MIQSATSMTKSPHVGVGLTRPSREDRYHVQVLDRALAILDVLSETSGQFSPAEIAGRLSLRKSTLHRLLMVLQQHRFIRRHPVHGKYGLGMRLFELGSSAAAQVNLRGLAEPFLVRLVQETNETAHLAVLSGTEMLSITNVESPKKVRTPTTVGGRTPIHCTAVGKAVLAYFSAAELEALLARLPLQRFTRRTLGTRRAVRAELLRVRARGYALDNEEIEEGLRCVGAPVRDNTSRVIAAMSIAGPVFRMTNERLPALARAVMDAARDLSLDLGYTEERRRVNGEGATVR